jgi:hypothetical protein
MIELLTHSTHQNAMNPLFPNLKKGVAVALAIKKAHGVTPCANEYLDNRYW